MSSAAMPHGSLDTQFYLHSTLDTRLLTLNICISFSIDERNVEGQIIG